MGNVTRLKSLQHFVFGDYTEPKFIPTNRDVQNERDKRFVAQKLLNGWDPKDVVHYLVFFNRYSEEKARKLVVSVYNRITTPLKELRRGYA